MRWSGASAAYESVVLHVFTRRGNAEFFTRTLDHRSVPQVLLDTYWNGVEDVRFAAYASPVQGSDWNIFVILFPQSRKVVTVEQEHFW